MDFNLKALGAETVMVDRRLVAKLVEAELLLRDGEKLPYEEELNQFIRQNSFIGVNPSERLFAKCAVTGKNAECIGLMVKPREICASPSKSNLSSSLKRCWNEKRKPL